MHNTYFFSDIHGNRVMFDAIMAYISNEDDEAMIVYGGDACDRGPEGYSIMRDLLNNPQVIYLKGNHEEMFTQAACSFARHVITDDYSEETWKNRVEDWSVSWGADMNDIKLAMYNGGLKTLQSWFTNQMDMDFIQQLEDLPLVFQYNEFDFSHAGGNPKCFQRIINGEYDDRDITNMLWDRNSLMLGWWPNRVCVHGHTPTCTLPSKYYGSKDKNLKTIHPVIWRGPFDKENYPGYKIDMDTAVFSSNIAYLLNCTTYQMVSFTIDNNTNTPIVFDKYYINEILA